MPQKLQKQPSRHSREGGNPAKLKHWIPAFAGMTISFTPVTEASHV